MTLPEPTGRIVEALKTRPDFIVLVVMQLVTLWVIYHGAGLAAAQRQEREIILLHQLGQCLDKVAP